MKFLFEGESEWVWKAFRSIWSKRVNAGKSEDLEELDLKIAPKPYLQLPYCMSKKSWSDL